jgi:hypothetical protein
MALGAAKSVSFKKIKTVLEVKIVLKKALK